MVRSLIGILLAFCISIVGFVNPVYANVNNSEDISYNHGVTINQGDKGIIINQGDNSSTNFNSFNSSTNEGNIQSTANNFINGLVQGFVGMAGTAIGGAIACYTLNAIATAFFPPAAAAAAFCPAISGVAGTGMAYAGH